MLKICLAFSKPYSNIATNSFYYLDETDSRNVTYADFAALKAADYRKTSYMLRHDKIITNNENNIILSLNRYGFFSSFENQYLSKWNSYL